MVSEVQMLDALQQQFNIRIITVSYPSYTERLNTLRTRCNNLRNISSNEINECNNKEKILLDKMNTMTNDQRDCVKVKFFNHSAYHIYVKACGEWREVAYYKGFILTKDGHQYVSFSDMGADMNSHGKPIFLIQ
jgi:hypothetical protein